MIKYACRPPYENAATIVNRGLPQLGLSPPGQGTLAGFGIEVDPNMAVVPGRVLPPPAIAANGTSPELHPFYETPLIPPATSRRLSLVTAHWRWR